MSERDYKYQLRDPVDEKVLDEYKKREKEKLAQELKRCELVNLLLQFFAPIISIVLFAIVLIIIVEFC